MARAFAPGHITGFFSPVIKDDPLRSGSLGAGIAIDLGATAEVELARDGIEIDIPYGRGEVTRRAMEIALREAGEKGVKVELELQLPSGQGFGMSGAGTLAASLALAELLGKEREDALRWSHTAEVLSRTGLSDVIGSFYGGMVIRKEAGIEPYGTIIRREIQRELWIRIIGPPIDTADFLETRGSGVSQAGKIALQKMLEDMSFSNFMEQSRAFAETLSSKDILDAIPEGFTGSQVMLGNSVFFTHMSSSGLISLSKRPDIPSDAIRCRIDNLGARVIG